MAYADDSGLLTDEEIAAYNAQELGTPVTSGSSSAATTGTTGGTGSTTAQTGSGAPSFVNLADYVAANESVKDTAANKISSDVTSDIGTATTDLNTTVGTQQTAAETAASSPYNQSNIAGILAGDDQSALTNLSDWWSTAENTTTAPVVTAADEIAKDYSALDTNKNDKGVSAYDTYFQETIGPSAASWLDRAVYGKSADAARSAASQTLSDFISSPTGAIANAQTAISDAWAKSDKAKKEAKGKLKDYMEKMRSGLSSTISGDFANLNTANLEGNTSPSSVHYVPGSVGELQAAPVSTPTYTPDVEGAIGGGILGSFFGPVTGVIGAVAGGMGEGDSSSAINKATNPLSLGSTGGQTPSTQTVNFNKMGTKPMEAVQDQYTYTPGTQASFDPTTGQYVGTISKQNQNTWNNLSKFLGGPTLTKTGESTSGSWVKKQQPTGGNKITTKRGGTPGRGK